MNILLKLFFSGTILLQALSATAYTPTWSTPVALYSTPDSANPLSNPIVGIDPTGNALVLYPTINGTTSFGGVAHITQNGTVNYLTTPTPGTLYQSIDGDYRCKRALSVNASNNALAAWIMFDVDNLVNTIQSSLFTAPSTWSNPSILNANVNTLNNTPDSSSSPQVFLHDDGTGVALWATTPPSPGQATALYYDIFYGTSWDSTIEKNMLTNGSSPLPETHDLNPILLDCPSGKVVGHRDDNPPVCTAVVYQDTANYIRIYGYVPGDPNPWQGIHTSYNNAIKTMTPKAAAMKIATGNTKPSIAVAWVNNDNTIQLYYYLANGSYSNESTINFDNPSNSGPISGIAVAVDSLDNIILSYTFQDRANVIYLDYVRNNGSYSQVGSLNISAGIYCLNPCIKADNNGNFYSLIQVNFDTQDKSILSNYYSKNKYISTSDGFTNTITLSQNGSCTTPSLAVNNDGNAVVTWIKNDITVEAVTTTPNTYQSQTTWFACNGQLPPP